MLGVERAKSITVPKRSLRPGVAAGVAGVDNHPYYNEKCMMLFGDAKASLTSGAVVRYLERLKLRLKRRFAQLEILITVQELLAI